MKRIAPIGFAFALALSGCADSSVVDPGDGGDGTGSGEQPQPEVDAQGLYRVNSTFDIATNLPGTTGSIVNGLIEATDDPDDPMSWVVDQMLAQMDDGTLKNILVATKPFVIGYLNDRVTDLAPDFVGTITELGQRMADLMKKLGIDERLEVNSVDQTYIGRIVVDGARFTIDGTVESYAFIDHDIDNVVVDSVLVQLQNESRLIVGEHTLPLPYGKLVRLGLDAAIIPAIDPSATSLTDLLDNVVDCQSVGVAINENIGGDPALWASICRGGLGLAADQVYEQIAASDEVLDLHIAGSARAADSNNDYKLDKLTFGEWSGMMSLSGDDAMLAQPATFVGTRM